MHKSRESIDQQQAAQNEIDKNNILDVGSISGIQICYKTNEPCKYNCNGLCRESY